MKTFARIVTVLVVFSFIVSCGGKPAATATQAMETQAPMAGDELTAAEQWAKDNGVGPYQPAVDDWAAIEAAAIQEGKVTVYSNSGGVEDLPDAWYALYPDIEFDAQDTDGIDTKMAAEQEAGNIIGDVWFNSDGHILYGQFVPNEWVWWFVPRDITIPELTEEQPIAVARHSVDVIGYNNVAYPDGCPINNIWALTEPEYYGKIFMEDPISDVSTMAKMATFVEHADDMAQAYLDYYGVPWTEDEKATPDSSGMAVEDAGYLWLKKLAQNGSIAFDDGDMVDAAFASIDLDLTAGEPGFGFTGYSSYKDTLKGELNMAPCFGLQPVMGLFKTSYLAIANNAPHPNAAKLFIKFILSADGMEPWTKIGTYPAADGLPVFEDNLPLDQMLKEVYIMNPIYDWENVSKVRDFWAASLLGQ